MFSFPPLSFCFHFNKTRKWFSEWATVRRRRIIRRPESVRNSKYFPFSLLLHYVFRFSKRKNSVINLFFVDLSFFFFCSIFIRSKFPLATRIIIPAPTQGRVGAHLERKEMLPFFFFCVCQLLFHFTYLFYTIFSVLSFFSAIRY